jgi:hypothetical protein
LNEQPQRLNSKAQSVLNEARANGLQRKVNVSAEGDVHIPLEPRKGAEGCPFS